MRVVDSAAGWFGSSTQSQHDPAPAAEADAPTEEPPSVPATVGASAGASVDAVAAGQKRP